MRKPAATKSCPSPSRRGVFRKRFFRKEAKKENVTARNAITTSKTQTPRHEDASTHHADSSSGSSDHLVVLNHYSLSTTPKTEATFSPTGSSITSPFSDGSTPSTLPKSPTKKKAVALFASRKDKRHHLKEPASPSRLGIQQWDFEQSSCSSTTATTGFQEPLVERSSSIYGIPMITTTSTASSSNGSPTALSKDSHAPSQDLLQNLLKDMENEEEDVAGVLHTDPEEEDANSSSISPQAWKSARNLQLHTNESSSSTHSSSQRSASSLTAAVVTSSEAVFSSPSNTTAATSSSSKIKILVLLLEPRAKIFELIQLSYRSRTTTLHDLLQLIPEKATTQELKLLSYVGFTTVPATSDKQSTSWITSKSNNHLQDIYASADTDDASKGGGILLQRNAGFEMGNVFAAVPQGYTASKVTRLARQILNNPNVQKSVDKTISRMFRKKHKSSSPTKFSPSKALRYARIVQVEEEKDRHSKSSSSKTVILAHNDTNDSLQPTQLERNFSYEQKNRSSRSKTHADKHTSSLDAYLARVPTIRVPNPCPSVSSQTSSYTNLYEELSLDGSYSSWSQSLENSIASRYSQASKTNNKSEKTSHRKSSRRERKKERAKLLQGIQHFAIVVIGSMMIYYYLDPRRTAAVPSNARGMGMKDLLYAFLLFSLLFKIQRLFQKGPVRIEDSKCPFFQLLALSTTD